MTCNACNAEGQRSRVYLLHAQTSLLAGTERFYDERGYPHVHDPNRRTEHYGCSRGHQFLFQCPTYCPTCDDGLRWSEQVHLDADDPLRRVLPDSPR